MNMKEIKEILQLMEEHKLSELEVDKDGLKVKFKKGGFEAVETHYAPAPHPSIQSSAASLPVAASAPALEAPASSGLVIKSPMVGTFYSSPAPDQPAYAKAGSKIKEGDVLCIVEAMKLMNEIKAEFSGEILEVLVKNGQPIEFDQPLFKIKKS